MSVYGDKALQDIGEMVVIMVNIFGWFVLIGLLLWGAISGLMSVLPDNTTEEVTIEQAE